MYRDCFDKQYYGFPSYSEYEEFEEILDLKTRSKKIQILEGEIENSFMDYRMYFQCNTCEEIFVLSIPDNAQRGYFLTQEDALKYQPLYSSDNNKKWGCLVIILILCSLLIYALF